ncbi:MAG: hypothetical protein QME51_04995 [Planctomycetota bacterium]|nr:hypothetical protein [Planctomycetota bacterium]
MRFFVGAYAHVFPIIDPCQEGNRPISKAKETPLLGVIEVGVG